MGVLNFSLLIYIFGFFQIIWRVFFVDLPLLLPEKNHGKNDRVQFTFWFYPAESIRRLVFVQHQAGSSPSFYLLLLPVCECRQECFVQHAEYRRSTFPSNGIMTKIMNFWYFWHFCSWHLLSSFCFCATIRWYETRVGYSRERKSRDRTNLEESLLDFTSDNWRSGTWGRSDTTGCAIDTRLIGAI